MVSLVALTCCTSPAPTTTPVSPVLGKTLVVTSTADSGSGTLRQALLDAQSGDTITFDPAVFPSNAPVTIYPTSSLPGITQGNITIDASNAGVTLDGSNILEGWVSGLEATSNGNTIYGLQVSNFSGAGIVLSGGAQYNTIGGDRSIGTGPFSQGNLTSGNDIGIGLWNDDTSFNTIMGNLIGTDVSGVDALGNHGNGIYVGEGACFNIIGPGNIIANNGGAGIGVTNSDSLGNTITQNSIYDNDGMGIDLWDGGNTELATPFIFDFDLVAGTVTGTASANCTVEIFSDNSDEGEVYEGKTTTDGLSVFTFNKGAPFTGPHLTATATDAEGNTSEFSVSTSGTRRYVILQEGNHLPKTQLQPKRSRELTDNRIQGLWGGLWAPRPDDYYDYQAILNEIVSLGLKGVRLAINNLDWDRVDWTKPEFSIDPRHDDFITSIADNGVTVTYVLQFWDKALGEEGRTYPRFKTEEEIQCYLDFVQFIVHHFKDRVQYFEIWNEPNIGDCVQWIEVADYINLVKRVVPVIRQEYPEAKIVVGGTTSLREPESQDYLFGILRSDILPLVDAVSWHPMYGTAPDYDYYRQYYYEYPAIVQEIKDVASAHGFNGEYIGDELSWWTPETAPPGQPWTHSETVSAKYYARGIVMHLGVDVTVGLAAIDSWLRPVVFSTVQNLCAIMPGAEPISLPIEIQSEATNVRSYGFSLPNGDTLIALWTDGVVVDEDPGMKANLILPDFSAQKVMGIDVRNVFEQQLVTSIEDGNLVIRNLLVKDYPIILRLTP